MKADDRIKGTTDNVFMENWGRNNIGRSDTENLPEYDPMSIMHYW